MRACVHKYVRVCVGAKSFLQECTPTFGAQLWPTTFAMTISATVYDDDRDRADVARPQPQHARRPASHAQRVHRTQDSQHRKQQVPCPNSSIHRIPASKQARMHARTHACTQVHMHTLCVVHACESCTHAHGRMQARIGGRLRHAIGGRPRHAIGGRLSAVLDAVFYCTSLTSLHVEDNYIGCISAPTRARTHTRAHMHAHVHACAHVQMLMEQGTYTRDGNGAGHLHQRW